MMLYTKYQSSRQCGFRQGDFNAFPTISLCKTRDLMSVPFMAQVAEFKQTSKRFIWLCYKI